MPFHLYQAAHSTDAVKGMVAHPQDRSEAARKLIEGFLGTLHHFFFSFGDYDLVALIEAPDDKVMAAGALAVAAAGTAARSRTTKLMTATEAMEAMASAGKAIGSYKAPMS